MDEIENACRMNSCKSTFATEGIKKRCGRSSDLPLFCVACVIVGEALQSRSCEARNRQVCQSVLARAREREVRSPRMFGLFHTGAKLSQQLGHISLQQRRGGLLGEALRGIVQLLGGHRNHMTRCHIYFVACGGLKMIEVVFFPMSFGFCKIPLI